MNNLTTLLGNYFGYGTNNGLYSDLNSNPNFNPNPGSGGLGVLIVRKFTVGRVGVPGCDFNFAAAADHAKQSLDLGEILPAKSLIIAAIMVCVENVQGVTDFQGEVGSAAGTNDIIATNSLNNNNEALSRNDPYLVPVWDTPNHIFFSGDPTDNTWNLMISGKWEIYIAYLQF